MHQAVFREFHTKWYFPALSLSFVKCGRLLNVGVALSWLHPPFQKLFESM